MTSGAASHRRTYKFTQTASVGASTALTSRSQGTLLHVRAGRSGFQGGRPGPCAVRGAGRWRSAEAPRQVELPPTAVSTGPGHRSSTRSGTATGSTRSSSPRSPSWGSTGPDFLTLSGQS